MEVEGVMGEKGKNWRGCLEDVEKGFGGGVWVMSEMGVCVVFGLRGIGREKGGFVLVILGVWGGLPGKWREGW